MAKMKYIILLGDGMADYPLPELGDRTPLMVARTPNMDAVASRGTFGFLRTASEGFPPGSDIMNMNILGYDPALYYTGRAPIEAAGMSIEMSADDVAFRCNLVSLRNDEGRVYMEDYSAGHIGLEEGDAIISFIDEYLGKDDISFHPGKSYRHIMLWTNGPTGLDLTPPHDILERDVEPYMPKNDFLLELMEKSRPLLQDHPVNRLRRASGKLTADSIWFWGEGKKPKLPPFREKWGIEGVIVTAVDLLKGIGVLADLETPDIPGATGYIDTNYENKVNAAIEGLHRADFAFVHVEAPDECGHNADVDAKIRAIEDFDSRVVGNVLKEIEEFEMWRLLVLPDHPTPIEVRTHVTDPVPFAMLTSDDVDRPERDTSYAESARPEEHPNYFDSCRKLHEIFFSKE